MCENPGGASAERRGGGRHYAPPGGGVQHELAPAARGRLDLVVLPLGQHGPGLLWDARFLSLLRISSVIDYRRVRSFRESLCARKLLPQQEVRQQQRKSKQRKETTESRVRVEQVGGRQRGLDDPRGIARGHSSQICI